MRDPGPLTRGDVEVLELVAGRHLAELGNVLPSTLRRLHDRDLVEPTPMGWRLTGTGCRALNRHRLTRHNLTPHDVAVASPAHIGLRIGAAIQRARGRTRR